MADGEPRAFARANYPLPAPAVPYGLEAAPNIAAEPEATSCSRAVLWRLCMRHRSQWIRQLLKWGVPSVHDAEDILADVTVGIGDAVDVRLAAIHNPEAWLTRLLRHRSIDVARKRRRGTATLASLPAHRRLEHDHPEAMLGAEELRQLAEAAYLELPIAQRQVLAARGDLGLSYQEIAAFQGCSATAARKRYQYARERITHALRRGGL